MTLSLYRAYLGLGSNLAGDLATPTDQLVRARDILLQHPQIEDVETSGVYATQPWGVEEQDDFANAVISVNTSLRPIELLHFAQFIEHTASRVREQRWGPRTVDVDVLSLFLLSDATATPAATPVESHGRWGTELIVPHPYAQERAFVLVPWGELASSREEWCLLHSKSISDHIEELRAQDPVEVSSVIRMGDFPESYC